MIFLVSCSENDIRPIKYKLEDGYLDCNGLYVKNALKEVVCLNESGTLLMKKKMIGSSDSNSFVLHYSDGSLKEKGIHLKNNPIGVWESYFENGAKESYRYYEVVNDTSFTIYEKRYLESVDLESSMLLVSTEISSENIYVDSTYILNIGIEYTEFDTLKSIVFLDKNIDIEYERDSLLSHSKEVFVKFTPRRKGELVISGIYAELGKGISDERNIADRNFEKKILVK